MQGSNGFGKGFGSRGLRRPFYWSLWKTLDNGKLKFEYLWFLIVLIIRLVSVVRVFCVGYAGFR